MSNIRYIFFDLLMLSNYQKSNKPKQEKQISFYDDDDSILYRIKGQAWLAWRISFYQLV